MAVAVLGAAAALVVSGMQAQAVDLTKADNTNNLNGGSSYVENVAPTINDVVVYNSTVTGANASNVGGNMNMGGIRIVDPGGPISIGGSQVLTIGASGINMSAATQDLTINTGTLRLGPGTGTTHDFNVAAGRTLTINSPSGTVQGGTHTVNINGAGNVAYLGNWTGNGGNLAVNFSNAAATLTLGGVNSFPSALVLGAGTVIANNDGALNTGRLDLGNITLRSTNGAHTYAASGIRLTGSPTFDGSNSLTFNGPLQQRSGNRTITNNITGGANTLNFTGAISLTTDPGVGRTLTVTGSGNTILSGAVSDGSGAAASNINYTGTGTLALNNNANNYTGNTGVSSGTLLVNGVNATSTGTVNVTGTGTLGGTGSIAGPINMNIGGTALAPGNGGSGGPKIGTLTASTVNLAPATGTLALNFQFGENNQSDRLVVSTADGMVLGGDAGSKVFNFSNGSTGGVASGTYTLIDYNGAALADLSQFSVAALPPRVTLVGGALINNIANTSIDAQLTADAPKWVGGDANSPTVWDVNTTQNWQEIVSGNATNYLIGDHVRFDDTAVGTSVDVSTTVAPSSITIDNPTKAYTFTGSGKITGTTGIVKNGAASATLATTGGNDFTGGVTINGGTLNIVGHQAYAGNTTVNGGGTLAIAGNSSVQGALNLNNGATFSMTAPGSSADPSIFPNNAIVLGAGAAATINSTNIGNGYTGNVTGDAASTLSVTGNTSFGAGSNVRQLTNMAGTLRVEPGATLRFSASSGLNNGGDNTTFDVLGTLTTRNTGTVNLGALTGTGALTGPGNVDNNTATYVIGAKNLNSTFAGEVRNSTGIGRVAALTKTGTGTQTMTGTLSYTGATNVTGGKLLLNTNLVGTSALNVSNAAVVELASNGTNNRAIKAGTVAVTGTARLDLKDNKLITTSPLGTATPGPNDSRVYSGVSGLIQSGFVNGQGDWSGPGIVTTTEAAQGGLTTLGSAKASEVLPFESETILWGGQTVGFDDTLVMYTHTGDANLDGAVDGGDYAFIDAYVGSSAGDAAYYKGDFNYDGYIDGGDYAYIDVTVGATPIPINPAALGDGGSAGAGLTAVPEPASLSVIGLGAAALLGRRRRRNA